MLALKSLAAKFWDPRITQMSTDEDRGTQGCAWTSQAGAALSNPFTSKLARDCEKPIAHLATQIALLRPEISGKKHQFALGFQAGMCCEKASASPLASVFCKTAPAFAQRIKPVIFGLPIRENLSHPWLKAILTFAARMTLWFAATTLYQPLVTRYCHSCEFV